MKFKTLFIVAIWLLFGLLSFAESPTRLSFIVEFGGNQVNTSLNERWNIRQDVGSNYYDSNNSSNSVSADMYVTHFAVKPEISLFEDKLAFSSGLRFSNILSDLSVVGNSLNHKGFFYLLYNSTGLNTEYARVNSINESSNYLGIPFDIKFVPFTLGKLDFYFKTGVELNYQLSSKTKINFVNESMNEYQQPIIENVGLSLNDLYSTWSNSVGVTIGSKNKLRYNIEILLPSFFITKNNSTIVNGDMFSGFKCSIQLPVR